MANNDGEKSGMPPPKFDDDSAGAYQYQPENPAAAWSYPPGHQSATAAPAAAADQPRAVRVIVARPPSLKTLSEAYLLWFPLGLFGLHHFYLRRYAFGFLYLFTGGIFGIGWLIDAFRMPLLVRDANGRIQRVPTSTNDENEIDKKISLIDAYLMWFPLGVLGLHHYYMRRPAWGVLYTFTLGLFGIGWLIDAFRMPCMVSEANERLAHDENIPTMKTLGNAYALGATPAGLFGAHHFYLGRVAFGIYYMLTLGGFGIGWIVDWFRMPWLVERSNNANRQLLGTRHKFVDDAYVMAFPAGFLGLHQFYLERPCWGVLYLFTGGLFGVGWLVDLCRMPCLVAETNKRLAEDAALMYEVREKMDGNCIVTGKSEIVVIPAYHHRSPASAQPPQQQTSVVINPSMLGFSGPNAESVVNPPPYTEARTEKNDYMTQPTLGQPPAYAQYGSMDDVEKKWEEVRRVVE